MTNTGLQKATGFYCVLFVLAYTTLNAQVIYLGARNDGFAKSTHVESDPALAIYSGGVNDGFAITSFAEPDPSNDIYRGGANDGFAKSSFIEPHPANDIYRGSVNDGFAFNSHVQADPALDIYEGGINDGFAFNSYSESDPSSDIYAGGSNDGFAKFFFSEELALPVEWKYFTVTKKNGKPFLQWGADKEEKCLSYEVLRSPDGKNFEPISEMACHGNAINNEYEFEDRSPLWYRILYYKIAQYDIDGEFTYSVVRAFNSNEPSESEVFYKNGQLIAKTDREAKLKSVAVFDFTGRILCSNVAEEQDGYYTIDCQLVPRQLVIVQMTFDSFTQTSHMRVSE